MRQMKWLTILCAGSLLAGCASQGTPAVPSGTSSNGAMGSSTPAHASKKGTLVLRVKVPKIKRAGRHAHYVSPATLSMVVAITGPTAVSQTVNLTPTSSGCTSTLTNTLCQLSIALKAGSYTATITTFDAVGGAGNKLSTAQAVPFTVVAGTSNNIALTLSGIPSSIVVVPGSAFAVTSANGIIDLFGTAANKMTVEALDADGNIISGNGAPSFVVNVAFGALAVTLTQPTAGAPNVFYVTPPSTYSGSTATLSVQATFNTQQTDGCAQTGANCFANAKVNMVPLDAAASTTGFSVFQATQSTPFATVSGLSSVRSIAFDPAGNLYVLNAAGITAYAPPYVAPSYTITTGLYNPQAIHFDSSGNLWLVNCPTCVGIGTDSVARYPAPITSASTPSGYITTGIAQPSAIADDGAGNTFVANVTGNAGAGSVTEYDSNGSLIAAITNTVAAPNALAYDSAIPAIFVSNPSASVEEYVGPSYNGAAPGPLSLPTSGTACNAGGTVINNPVAIAVDSSLQRIFVANSSLGTVNAVTEFRFNGFSCRGFFDAGGNPVALLIDGLPRLYVADNSANTVSVWPVASNPTSIGTITFTAPVALATAP